MKIGVVISSEISFLPLAQSYNQIFTFLNHPFHRHYLTIGSTYNRGGWHVFYPLTLSLLDLDLSNCLMFSTAVVAYCLVLWAYL